MKKKYESPELELLETQMETFIAASSLDISDTDATEPGLSRDEDIFSIINGGLPF